jgi:hypothetical protein
MIWGLFALAGIGVLFAVCGRSFRAWLSKRSTVSESENSDYWSQGENDEWPD